MTTTQKAAVAAIEKQMVTAKRAAFNAGIVLRLICRKSDGDAERALAGFEEGKDLAAAAKELRRSSGDGGLTAVELEQVLRRFYGMNERMEDEEAGNEAGEAILLPCRPGDKVYTIKLGLNGKKVMERTVGRIDIWESGIDIGVDVWKPTRETITADEIGKRLFLRREDAERAMEEAKTWDE